MLQKEYKYNWKWFKKRILYTYESKLYIIYVHIHNDLPGAVEYTELQWNLYLNRYSFKAITSHNKTMVIKPLR